MMKRESISKRIRFNIFKRDGFRCSYCGAHPSDTILLEVDHIHPIAEGGSNSIDNLITSCKDCNRGKGAALLSVVPQSLQEKATDAQEREAQIVAYYKILATKKRRKDREIWDVAKIYMERFGQEDIARRDLISIKTFLNRLDFFEVLEAMEIACNKQSYANRAFRYFCGICWSKIKQKSAPK
jgi:CRISPR/Cas system Type II protein with McrA/HNH and RuvC-like nuclease domain